MAAAAFSRNDDYGISEVAFRRGAVEPPLLTFSRLL
jgi:hypothetical protein